MFKEEERDSEAIASFLANLKQKKEEQMAISNSDKWVSPEVEILQNVIGTVSALNAKQYCVPDELFYYDYCPKELPFDEISPRKPLSGTESCYYCNKLIKLY